MNEVMFRLQQIQQIGVKRTLHTIIENVHLVTLMVLGIHVTSTDATTLTLYHVTVTVRPCQMMHGSNILDIHTSTQLTSATQQDTHLSTAGTLNDRLTTAIRCGIVHKHDLILRNMMLVDKGVFDIVIHIPLLARHTEVTEHQLTASVLHALLIFLNELLDNST